ncbi:unnamed protein product, partial [Darwinula stevensoni]
SRARRNGKFIEKIGTYNPITIPATIDIDVDQALKWLENGAQPTDTCKKILSYKGVLYKKHLKGGVAKGAFDEQEMEKKFNDWVEAKEKIANEKIASLEQKKQDFKNAQIEAAKKANAEKILSQQTSEESAHPDDVELGCGATVAKYTNKGMSVGILDLTQGELGTRGNEFTRKQEAEKAAEILKVKIRYNLKFKDGFFIDDKEHQLKIIQKIREFQPDIVLANAINDRHPDHPKAGKLISTACFLSGLTKIDTNQKAWRPKHVFHYIQWDNLKPDFVIDISEYIDIKLKACLAYSTQFYNPQSSEPDTPITSKNFEESIVYRAKDLGRLIGTNA